VSDKVLQKLRDERECWRKRFTAVKDDCMKWDEMPSELTELLQLVSQDAATATEGATGSECDLGRSRGHDVTSAGGREDFSWIGGVAAAGAESSSPATSLEATLRERQISRTSDISGDTSPALSAEIAAMTESDLDKLLADEPLSPDEEPPDDSMPELLVAGSFSDVTVSLRPEPETVRHERLVHPSDESPTPSPGQLGLLRHEVTGLLSDDVDSVSVEKKEP
jgi:hypothetical protein